MGDERHRDRPVRVRIGVEVQRTAAFIVQHDPSGRRSRPEPTARFAAAGDHVLKSRRRHNDPGLALDIRSILRLNDRHLPAQRLELPFLRIDTKPVKIQHAVDGNLLFIGHRLPHRQRDRRDGHIERPVLVAAPGLMPAVKVDDDLPPAGKIDDPALAGILAELMRLSARVGDLHPVGAFRVVALEPVPQRMHRRLDVHLV